ncbi:MAG TPA: BON domain-containing protein [Burkholderiaceae bacterium]|jgi:osmotically-inducible protein OsmY|nr:BON domain-containing protein [Burkholderiaceae bacterium]
MRSVVLLLLIGCAHSSPVRTSAFDRAYAQVASGARTSAHSDGYLIEKSGGEVVHVAREAPAGGLQRDVSDAWITAEVSGRLGTGDIHVATDAGVVTLRGKLASRDQAMQAIRAALELSGVAGVNSALRF